MLAGPAGSELETCEELPDGSCQPGFEASEPSDTRSDGASAEKPAKDFAARQRTVAKPVPSSAELLAPDAMHPE